MKTKFALTFALIITLFTFYSCWDVQQRQGQEAQIPCCEDIEECFAQFEADFEEGFINWDPNGENGNNGNVGNGAIDFCNLGNLFNAQHAPFGLQHLGRDISELLRDLRVSDDLFDICELPTILITRWENNCDPLDQGLWGNPNFQPEEDQDLFDCWLLGSQDWSDGLFSSCTMYVDVYFCNGKFKDLDYKKRVASLQKAISMMDRVLRSLPDQNGPKATLIKSLIKKMKSMILLLSTPFNEQRAREYFQSSEQLRNFKYAFMKLETIGQNSLKKWYAMHLDLRWTTEELVAAIRSNDKERAERAMNNLRKIMERIKELKRTS